MHKQTSEHEPINSIFYANEYSTPTLKTPVSQLCTYSQFQEPEYYKACEYLKVSPRLHRKQWENVFILNCLEYAGMLKSGKKGLGFGVGRERLSSFLASKKCKITATDLPQTDDRKKNWEKTNQHCSDLNDLHHDNLVSIDELKKYVKFVPVDMNNIPKKLKNYDFCWSSCALEHLGSLQHGLDFIKNSIKCIKPGGVIVHTTEFNLKDEHDTFESVACSVYRKKDIENFVNELRDDGHLVDVNFNSGNMPQDKIIDVNRNNKQFHLKIDIHGFTSTSFGFFIRKAK